MLDDDIRALIRTVFPGHLTVREQLLQRRIVSISFRDSRYFGRKVRGRLRARSGTNDAFIDLNCADTPEENANTIGHELAHHIADYGIFCDNKSPVAWWPKLVHSENPKIWKERIREHDQEVETLCDHFGLIWLGESNNRTETLRLIQNLREAGKELHFSRA